MRPIILIGASPKSRLVIDFLKTENRLNEVAYLTDQNSQKHGTMFYGKKIIGDINYILNKKNASKYSYCVCLSEKRFDERLKLQLFLESKQLKIASIISKTAYISKNAKLMPGDIIFPGVIINGHASIGKCCTLLSGSLIEHDCVIHENVEIASRVAIAGGVQVGSESFIGINATIMQQAHPLSIEFQHVL